jgi:glycosyltransferase involved in cell wall biosynthesis
VNAQRDWAAAAQRHLVEPLRHADVVLVASDRQRHLAVGALAALGRLTPRVVAEDPALDRLVRVVPFGTPDGPPPVSTARPLTGPGGLAGPGARVALWGGGLYDWLDPLTLVEAVARSTRDDLVAVFLAGRHPTPAVGHAPLVDRVRERAADLGLLGRRVVVHEEWVPYAERIDWLADAAVGVSLHHRHVETEFAFRTRILDYLWAGLPVVCSGGDHWAEVVAARGLGATVAPDDVDGAAAALDRLAEETAVEGDERRGRARVVAAEHAWSTVAAPLLDVCARPGRAPDRRVGDDPPGALGGVAAAARRVTRAARGRW